MSFDENRQNFEQETEENTSETKNTPQDTEENTHFEVGQTIETEEGTFRFDEVRAMVALDFARTEIEKTIAKPE